MLNSPYIPADQLARRQLLGCSLSTVGDEPLDNEVQVVSVAGALAPAQDFKLGHDRGTQRAGADLDVGRVGQRDGFEVLRVRRLADVQTYPLQPSRAVEWLRPRTSNLVQEAFGVSGNGVAAANLGAGST